MMTPTREPTIERVQARTAADRLRDQLTAAEAPVSYEMTVMGYAATTPQARAARQLELRASRGRSHPAPDEPVPYALAARAAQLFVVDTANVAELRRRCPELFAAQRPASGAVVNGRDQSPRAGRHCLEPKAPPLDHPTARLR